MIDKGKGSPLVKALTKKLPHFNAQPTFSNFVNAILRGVTEDHVQNYIEFCSMCLYQYDVIGHTENSQEDMK